MKVLILGGSGQLGHALVNAAPVGIELVALDRAGCDIAIEGAALRAIEQVGPDLILNAAAYTAVDRAESEPAAAWQVNALAPAWIAAAARECGARMVHVSTDFVFDGRSWRPYAPGAETAPIGVYGRSKSEGERGVLAAQASALIVRTAWVYAAHHSNFLTTMLRLMRDRDEIAVVADQFGSPTFAGSLAHALWALATLKSFGIYHFTDSGAASWYDFAVAIAEEAFALGILDQPVFVRPIRTEQYATAARRPPFSVLDCTATSVRLGSPAPHWRVNLRRALKEIEFHA